MTRPVGAGETLGWRAYSHIRLPTHRTALVWDVCAAGLAVIILVEGCLGLSWWVGVPLLVAVIASVLVTHYAVWYASRSVTGIWLEPSRDVDTFRVLRVNGTRGGFPVAAVTRIKVTEYRVEPPSLTIKLWIGTRVEHTLTGLAAPARPLLAAFAEAGASVAPPVTRPRTSD